MFFIMWLHIILLIKLVLILVVCRFWLLSYISISKQRRRLITHANAKSKSEKFPPPHQDGTLGYPLGSSHHLDPVFDPPDVPFSSSNFTYSKAPIQTWSGPLVDPAAVGAPRRKKYMAGDGHAQSKQPKDSHRDKNSARVKEKEGM